MILPPAERVATVLADVPRRQRLGDRAERAVVPGGVPLERELAVLAAPRLEALAPGGVRLRAALGAERVVDAVGHEEGLVGVDAVGLLGRPGVVVAERLAVHVGRAGVRAPEPDDRLDVDQRGPLLVGLGLVDRGAQGVEVVGVVDERTCQP
jgi:hypothetical protein